MRLRCMHRKATEKIPSQLYKCNGMAVAKGTIKQMLIGVMLLANLAFGATAIKGDAI